MDKSREEQIAAALDMKIARKREIGRDKRVFSRIYVYKIEGVEAVPLDRVNFKSLKMQEAIRQRVRELLSELRLEYYCRRMPHWEKENNIIIESLGKEKPEFDTGWFVDSELPEKEQGLLLWLASKA